MMGLFLQHASLKSRFATLPPIKAGAKNHVLSIQSMFPRNWQRAKF